MRRAVLARRDVLAQQWRGETSARIHERIVAFPEFDAARVVMAYSSFGSELDTSAFIADVYASGKTLVLPRVDRTSDALALFVVADPTVDLVANAWGIREPRVDACVSASVSQLDFVLVPGVAFDRRGGRLGYGKGYYDKLLHECMRAGVLPFTVSATFDAQIVDEVPMEPHDVRIDRVVTESFTQSRR